MDEWRNILVSHFPSLSVSLCVDQERKNERSIEKQKKILATGLSFVDKSLYMRQKKKKKKKKNMTNEQKMAAQCYPGPAEPSWGPWGSYHFPSGDCRGGFFFVANAVI